ncbi:MAG: hypothetical protein HY904_08950 [Deltaproteobacteria bacterium]|nr:hypothetical protein [Deltaproteobacteria bacterium]
MNPVFRTMVFTALMASALGCADGPGSGGAKTDDTAAGCGYDELQPPEATCRTGGSRAYNGVCAVDCLGNVYPYNSDMAAAVLPAGRHLAVFFVHQPGRPLPPAVVIEGFVGEVNVETEGPVEWQPGSRVAVTPSFTRDGDLFVRFRDAVTGPAQLALVLHSTPITAYTYRAYVGGVPPP